MARVDTRPPLRWRDGSRQTDASNAHRNDRDRMGARAFAPCRKVTSRSLPISRSAWGIWPARASSTRISPVFTSVVMAALHISRRRASTGSGGAEAGSSCVLDDGRRARARRRSGKRVGPVTQIRRGRSLGPEKAEPRRVHRLPNAHGDGSTALVPKLVGQHKRAQRWMQQSENLERRSVCPVEAHRQNGDVHASGQPDHRIAPLRIADSAAAEIEVRHLAGRKDAQHAGPRGATRRPIAVRNCYGARNQAGRTGPPGLNGRWRAARRRGDGSRESGHHCARARGSNRAPGPRSCRKDDLPRQ